MFPVFVLATVTIASLIVLAILIASKPPQPPAIP